MGSKELGLEMYLGFLSDSSALPCKRAHVYFSDGILWGMNKADAVYPIVVSIVAELRKFTGLDLGIVLDEGECDVHVLVIDLDRPVYYYRHWWGWGEWRCRDTGGR